MGKSRSSVRRRKINNRRKYSAIKAEKSETKLVETKQITYDFKSGSIFAFKKEKPNKASKLIRKMVKVVDRKMQVECVQRTHLYSIRVLT